MADEVVGKVVVSVSGDVDPLKKDIRDAAHEAGKEVGPEIASEVNKDSSITDAIVKQVDDAEKPVEQSGRKVGRAFFRGARRGTDDEQGSLGASVDRLFTGIGRSLEREIPALSAAFKQMSAQAQDAFDDAAGRIRKSSGAAGETIAPEVARGVRRTPAITEAVVAQVEDSVQPSEDAAVDVGHAVARGTDRGLRERRAILGRSLGNLFSGFGDSLEREAPLLTAAFRRTMAQVQTIFADESDTLQRASQDLGAEVTPSIAAGVTSSSAIPEAIVGQLTDAVIPAQQAGHTVGVSGMDGVHQGIEDEQPTVAQSLANMFGGVADSNELQQAVHAISDAVTTGTADDIGQDTSISDAIVANIADAMAPAEEGGRALRRSILEGAQSQIQTGEGASLFDQMLGQSLHRAAEQAGTGVVPTIAAGIGQDTSITDALVQQVEEAVAPAEEAGTHIHEAILQGARQGIQTGEGADLFDQMLGNSLQQAAEQAGITLPSAIADGVGENDAVTEAIVTQVDHAEGPAEESGHRTGQATARGVRRGVAEGIPDINNVVEDILDNVNKSLSKRTDQFAVETRARIRDILRVDPNQRGTLVDQLLGPQVMADLRRVLGQMNDLIDKETGKIDLEVNRDRVRGLMLDIDEIGNQITARFTQRGEQGAAGFQNGFQRQMKKAVSGGIFDALFKMLALKVGGLGSLVAFGVRAAAPVIIGLTSQITTAVVGLGEALGGLGAVGAGIGATLLPNMLALKFAMKGLDTDAKKALAKNFKEAAGELAKFPDILRSTLIPGLLDAVRTVRQLSPEISAFGRRTGEVAGNIAKNFATMLVANRGSINTILEGSSQAFARLGAAAVTLAEPLIEALAAMQPLIQEAVESISKTIEGLANRLDSAVTSGRFTETLERWYDSGKTLLQGFKNLGTVVWNFFKIANDTQGDFVKSFEKLTGEWADWTESIKGQNTLRTMFAEAKPVVEEVWKLLGDIAGLFTESFTGDTSDLVDFIHTIRTDFIPMVKDLQDIVRDSGIQDALYDLSQAFVELLKAGGGGVFAGFVTTLANLAEVLADLLDLVGPVLGPFLTFVGGVKALSLISGKGFGLIGSLPGMLTGLVAPASNATQGVKDLNDQMQELGGAAGGAGGRTGRFATFMEGIASKVNIALTAIVAMQTVVGATADKFSQSEYEAKRWADSAKKGALEVKNEIGEGVGPNWWEKFAPGGIITSLISGENPFAARNFGEELASDLGTGFNAKMKGFAANILGIDFGNLGATKDRITAQFEAIQTALEETGDVSAARAALEEFRGMLEDSGVSADIYADSLGDVEAAIEGVVAVTGTAASKKGGLDFFGDFTSTKTALESIGATLDQNLTDKIDAIRANSKYKDPLTGGLNPAGLQAIADAYKKANLDMINGLDDAISKADAKTLKGIVGNKANYDKFGNLTKDALAKIAEFLPGALARNEEAVKTHRENMEKILESENRLVVGRRAQREFGGGLGKLDKDVKEMAGEEIIRLRTEWENQGFTEDQIAALIKDRYVKIVAQAQTVDAFNDLNTLMGSDWQTEIKTKIPEADYIEVEGKLMHLTEDGTWEAVVGTEAETARAEEDIYTVTQGKDGDPWTATVKTHADTDGATKDMNKFLSQQFTVLVDARINKKFLYYVPGKGYVAGGALNPEAGTSMALPPSEPLIPAPSMISMGGPTMGGDGAAIGGFGVSARGGSPGISTYASRGRFSSNVPGDDDERKRVTVNVVNNYPEPEKVSDSIAMSLRIARWEMAGV